MATRRRTTRPAGPLQVSGVFPGLCLKAELGPPRTECGIGILMPWADLSHESDGPVGFRVEVDFLGHGAWKTYETVSVPARGYVHHEFPAGFSAHWVRVVADRGCRATAYFTYT